MKGIMSGLEPVRMQEGGDLNNEEMKLFGKDGLLFDPNNPLDYLLLVPGLGLAGMAGKAGLTGLRALGKSKPVQEALERTYKSLAKAEKSKKGPRRTEQGKIIKDVEAGKQIAGEIGTKTKKAALYGGVPIAAAVTGRKLDLKFPEGEEEQQVTLPQGDAGSGGAGAGTDTPQKTFFESLREAPGNLFKRLQEDPEFRDRFMAGSIAMTSATPGIVPTTGVERFYKGFETKKAEQEKSALSKILAAAQVSKASSKDPLYQAIEKGLDVESRITIPTYARLLLGGAADSVLYDKASGAEISDEVLQQFLATPRSLAEVSEYITAVKPAG